MIPIPPFFDPLQSVIVMAREIFEPEYFLFAGAHIYQRRYY